MVCDSMETVVLNTTPMGNFTKEKQEKKKKNRERNNCKGVIFEAVP